MECFVLLLVFSSIYISANQMKSRFCGNTYFVERIPSQSYWGSKLYNTDAEMGHIFQYCYNPTQLEAEWNAMWSGVCAQMVSNLARNVELWVSLVYRDLRDMHFNHWFPLYLMWAVDVRDYRKFQSNISICFHSILALAHCPLLFSVYVVYSFIQLHQIPW